MQNLLLNFPLLLKKHHVTEISISSPEEPVEGDPTLTLQPQVELGQNEKDSRDWRVSLNLKISAVVKEKPTHNLSVTLVGYVVVHNDVKDESVPQVASVNGASILYATARELVANLTARGPQKMLVLPALSFGNLALQRKEPATPPAKTH